MAPAQPPAGGRDQARGTARRTPRPAGASGRAVAPGGGNLRRAGEKATGTRGTRMSCKSRICRSEVGAAVGESARVGGVSGRLSGFPRAAGSGSSGGKATGGSANSESAATGQKGLVSVSDLALEAESATGSVLAAGSDSAGRDVGGSVEAATELVRDRREGDFFTVTGPSESASPDATVFLRTVGCLAADFFSGVSVWGSLEGCGSRAFFAGMRCLLEVDAVAFPTFSTAGFLDAASFSEGNRFGSCRFFRLVRCLGFGGLLALGGFRGFSG